jgi:hypothetical protein
MTSPIPSLAEFQRWMKSRIRPTQTAPAPEAEELLNAPEERLSVYAGGYLARMREALADVYEAVQFVLGERAFTELAQAYAARYPSHDYNLSFAGRSLPEFLAGSPIAQQLPFLPDLARLEWLVCRAFHAFEQPPLEPSRLAAPPPEAWDRLRLTFQPSLGVVASAWPIRDIWAARREPRGTVNLQIAGRAQRVLVFRRGLEVRCELLEEPECVLLEGLLAGRTLGEVCQALSQADPTAVRAWFARWMQERLIVRAEPNAAGKR